MINFIFDHFFIRTFYLYSHFLFISFLQIRKATNDRTEVHTIALENRAKDLNIHDLRSFYKSPLFRSHGLKLDEVNQLIIKQY